MDITISDDLSIKQIASALELLSELVGECDSIEQFQQVLKFMTIKQIRCGAIYYDDGTFFPGRVHCNKIKHAHSEGWRVCYDGKYIVNCCPDHLDGKRMAKKQITRRLYYISRESGATGYDEYDAHIVRAESEKEARDLCIHGDEGPKAWQKAKVEILREDGESGTILSSFNAG